MTRIAVRSRSQRNDVRLMALVAAFALAVAALGGVGATASASETASTAAQNPPDAPTGLTVNDLDLHPNVEGPPRFGWLPQDADGNEMQTAYQVVVSDGAGAVVIWDSGKVESGQQSYVVYGGPALDPGTTYTWTVRTWDTTDQVSPWADTATFDTGIRNGDWEGAQWIRRQNTEADDYTWARKEIAVADSPIVRARLYTAVSHTGEFFFNGERVHRGGGHGYSGEQYYEATDVTDAIEPGAPLAIGVVYHWYGNGQGRPAVERGLLVKLVIEHADGTRAVTVTDNTWRVTRATRFTAGSGTRNGEGLRIDRQDARAYVPGWDLPGFDAASWLVPQVVGAHPVGVFSNLIGQETRLHEYVVHPERILTANDGTLVADFGIVIPARPRVTFRQGVSGRNLTLRAGYTLQANGRVTTDTLQTQGTNMTFPFIQTAGEQDYEAFTHLAFRYFELPGAAEPLTVDDISAVVIHTEVPDGAEAHFESSDETLDAVWDLVKRSAIFSVQEHFVDTPTREQAQFLGDTAVISEALVASFGERAHSRQAINEFLQSQDRFWVTGADIGRYNAVYPNGDGKRDIPDYSQMLPIWVWEYYKETGDLGLLERAYPYLERTADYVLRHIPTTGVHSDLVTRLTGGSGDYQFGIIDWPTHNRFGYAMTTWARTRINALGVGVLQSTANVASALGRPASEVAFYQSRTDALIDAMNARLRLPNGTYSDGLLQAGTLSTTASQLSTSSAIHYGIAPEQDIPALADYLGSFGLRQGPMTVSSLLQALAIADRADLVHSLLTNPDDYGWADILARGGSFTWESWILAAGTNYSQSHGWGAVAAVDILETMLGIRTSSPGAETVDIVVPRDTLDHASGSVHTQRGRVSAAWERNEDGTVVLDVEIPVNVRSRVTIPQTEGMRYLAKGDGAAVYLGVEDGREVFEIGSGSTRFIPVTAAVAAVHDALAVLNGLGPLHPGVYNPLRDGLDKILIELSDEPRHPGDPQPCAALDAWLARIALRENRPVPQPGLTTEMANQLRAAAAAIEEAIGC